MDAILNDSIDHHSKFEFASSSFWKKKVRGGGERERVAAMEFSIIKSVVISPHGCFIAEIWTGIYCFSVGFGTQSV